MTALTTTHDRSSDPTTAPAVRRPALDPAVAPRSRARPVRRRPGRLPRLGLPWYAFALLLLVPDLSAIGYLRGPRLGAFVYNVVHDLATGAVVAGIGLAIGSRADRGGRRDPRRPQRDGPDGRLRPEAAELVPGHAHLGRIGRKAGRWRRLSRRGARGATCPSTRSR